MRFASEEDSLLGLSILALSALLEYVFPPFPGDTITLFGAFLITAKGWSFLWVFLAVLAGSAAGSMLDFWLGGWILRRRQRKHGRRPGKLDDLVDRFRKHGAWWLVFNRFMPGIRALFFVAAGMAGLKARWVLFWSVVSAALWTLLLIAVGAAIGANFEALEGVFATYSKVAWGALAALVAGYLIVTFYRKRKQHDDST